MPAPLPSLPGFRLYSWIGSGPSGRVYRARDEAHGRDVAVKLLDPRRCTPRGLDRLAEIAARAATSPVARDDQRYEVVPHPAQPFVVMDLLPGENLQRMLLRTGPMPWRRARAVVHAIAVALEAAHDVGVVHGAVKPTNIFFHNSLVILTDFGIRALPEPHDREARLADAGRMAPEQLRGEAPDVRSDVYGLGLVMYELVTGRLPFVGRPHEVFQHQLRRPPPAPSSFASDLPPAADALLRELLDKHPSRRPPSASRLRGVLASPERLPDHPLSMATRMSWRRPPDLRAAPEPAPSERAAPDPGRGDPRGPSSAGAPATDAPTLTLRAATSSSEVAELDAPVPRAAAPTLAHVAASLTAIADLPAEPPSLATPTPPWALVAAAALLAGLAWTCL